jgi:hypothetical protein
LNDNTNHVDQAAHDDSPFTSNAVRDITSDDGTEESTGRENRDDERGVGRTDSIWDRAIGVETLDVLNEERGWQDTVDVTGVVTKEDTTKGGKGANEVGLEGDGRLNAVDVLGWANDGHDGGYCFVFVQLLVVVGGVYSRLPYLSI